MRTANTQLEVRETLATGRGLFACAPISSGDFIIEYTGKRITTLEADTHTGRYLFEVDDDWTLDGDTKDNLAKYINHSCEPNTEAEVEDGHVNMYAARDIQAGEELTIDYGDEYFDEFIKPVGCKCGSAKHRS